MRVTAAFSRLLRLPGVSVRDVVFGADRISVTVALRRRRLACPLCAYSTRARHDTRPVESVWRHLDLGAWRLEVRAGLRRLDCPTHGVRVEGVPFARPGSRHTVDFEDLVAYLATTADKTTICRLVRIDWDTVGRIISRVMADKLDPGRLEELFEIGVDEVSWRKRHNYLTLVSNHRTNRVASGAEGRGTADLDGFRPSPGLEPNGTGVLGPYRGIEPPNRDDYSEAAMLPSQVAQLRYALTNGDPGVAPRHVDALTLSAGGNDMGFGPVALVCTLYYECKDHFVSGARGEGPVRLSVRFGQSVATMAARYTALGAELATLPIAKTYITQYPDPSRGPGGALCPAILDDVIPGWMAPFLGLVAVAESLPPPLPPYQIDGGDRPDGGEVARW